MKSYSNDIPNISTEELKRSVEIGDETNGLIKKNYHELQLVQHNVENIKQQVKTVKTLTVLIATISVLTLSALGGLIYLTQM